MVESSSRRSGCRSCTQNWSTKSVIVYRLVSKDTVEERILLLQERKRQLAETALGGASQGASITKEDLLELLK